MSRNVNWNDDRKAGEMLAGNWQSWSFCWFGAPDDGEAWVIWNYETCSTGLLERSNGEVMIKRLGEVDADGENWHEEHHGGAFGAVEAIVIRPIVDGEVTAAWAEFCEMQREMEQYPVLDEEHWSNLEYEATLDNIASAIYSFDYDYDGSKEDLAGEIYHWLSRNNDHALESTDDSGAWPSDEDLEEALAELGYLVAEES